MYFYLVYALLGFLIQSTHSVLTFTEDSQNGVITVLDGDNTLMFLAKDGSSFMTPNNLNWIGEMTDLAKRYYKEYKKNGNDENDQQLGARQTTTKKPIVSRSTTQVAFTEQNTVPNDKKRYTLKQSTDFLIKYTMYQVPV